VNVCTPSRLDIPARWPGSTFALLAVKPRRPTAAFHLNLTTTHVHGPPCPHIIRCLRRKFVAGVQLLHRAAKVAPSVRVLRSAVEAGGVLGPTGLAPVHARLAVVPQDADHLLHAARSGLRCDDQESGAAALQ
jgi:hypothetical protein